MNKLVLVVSFCTFGLAHAQSGKTDKPAPAPSGKAATPGAAAATPTAPPGMEMPKPGPEQDALKPFVKNSTSAGTIAAGAMGPGSPETPTKGKATCKWVSGNMWAVCDIEDTTGSGKTAMKWMGHWVFGYDVTAKGYRGTMSDNMGTMMALKGTMEGAKMTWESGDIKVPNMPTKFRFTEDAADPKAIKFTEEGMVGGKWVPRGTAVRKPAGK